MERGDIPAKKKKMSEENNQDNLNEDRLLLCVFKNEEGEEHRGLLVYYHFTSKDLDDLLQQATSSDESLQCKYFIKDVEINGTLSETLNQLELAGTSSEVEIYYVPQAIFKVRAVTRCTSTIEGHAEAILSVQFNPNGRYLASGSGDTTVRFWDIYTESPQYTCKGHKHWVLAIAWSPDGKTLASGCKNGLIMLWNPANGSQKGSPLKSHSKWITSLAWKPMHLDGKCRLLASASKDGSIKIWDTVLSRCMMSLTSHTQSVTCVRWGGTNLIYSGSQDRTIKVWRASDGVLCRTLQGHGHWVNSMGLSCDYVLRTSCFDPAKANIVHETIDLGEEAQQKLALERYQKVVGSQPERLVTASDDLTMFLWTPESSSKSVARLTGHMQVVNHVAFSPSTLYIASASYDKSIKLWNGRTGAFITTFLGHVQRVYQVSWSADSRLLCSSSADSTLKIWNVERKKLLLDLGGHADEVYALDWSPDSQRVASGGKDKVLKLWRQ
ncbi:DgyrCDS4422 [Dimorphilus gyrociliatus]|uniref:DgyrCDS4422 n=1 Tax=Dimorphilus gyrociliatus TaxID=2664684 RepID=A0A7I8VLK6_9ANNE|nr:DgyrCDS4422 [Dimorphilus gyrociliatus]